MCRVYNDTPYNFNEIEPYVVTNVDDAVKYIIQSEKCYFYDTCSFRKHMLVPQPENILNYIKQTNGIVIITRCILMELCSNNGELWAEHIAYIKDLTQSGIVVLVIYEEDIISVLSACFSGISKINRMLSIAVMNAKSKTGTIENVLNSDFTIKKEILIDSENADGSLAKRFFEKVRSNKISGDNLGEELIAICIHLLCNIREFTSYKYIILTDDKGAVALFSKTIQNVEKHTGNKCISCITTAKLCWLLLANNIITSKDQVEAILKSVNSDEYIKVHCSEKFELLPSEKSMKITELSEKLTNNSGIKIYF